MTLKYFRGWRRKLGCVTLVMALVLMVGWIRSGIVQEGPILQSSEHITYSIVSRDGTLHLARANNARRGARFSSTSWASMPRNPEAHFLTEMPRTKWRWQAAGFGISDLTLPQQDFTFWTAPYWFPTGTLAIVSAWLLLAKPSPRPQPNPGP